MKVKLDHQVVAVAYIDTIFGCKDVRECMYCHLPEKKCIDTLCPKVVDAIEKEAREEKLRSLT